MKYGSKVNGRLESIQVVTELAMSNPNDIYELEIETEGIPDEDVAIQQLLQLEQQYVDLRVLYVETNQSTGKVRVQITDIGPGQFSFAGIFSAIPALFILAGIVVVAYVLWQVFQQNPIWLYLLAVLGGGIAFYLLLGPAIAGMPQPKRIREPTAVTTPTVVRYETQKGVTEVKYPPKKTQPEKKSAKKKS